MVSFLNRLLTRMIEYDFETGEVTLRTDDEIFELGDDDPLLIEGVFQHKDLPFGSLGLVSKEIPSEQPETEPKTKKNPSALGALFGDDKIRKTFDTKTVMTATANTFPKVAKQEVEAMSAMWENDVEIQGNGGMPHNSTRDEPTEPNLLESPTHLSTLQKSIIHSSPKRLPADRLVKIVYDFTPDEGIENQLKARRGQQFWEMTRAAPSSPPDPEGWIYCVYSKDGSRQGWIPLTQIVFLGKSSKSMQSYNQSELSTKSLPYMLQGYRRGISVGSKYKGLVFLYSMDNDTFMNHGCVPFPIGALKKHDLHDVGSVDAKVNTSSLTHEQSTFLLEAEDNWKSRTRPKSAGGAFVTNTPSLTVDRPATAQNRRRISKKDVNLSRDESSLNASSSLNLPRVEFVPESRDQSLSSSADKRILVSHRDEGSLSSHASTLLSMDYGIKDRDEVDPKVAATIVKKSAQVYGRNAYLLPSLK